MPDVWASAALRDGLIVTSTPDGAVIHLAGRPTPEVRPLPGTLGRTLHIGPGVALTEVGEFVGSLPPEVRPAYYTISPGVVAS